MIKQSFIIIILAFLMTSVPLALALDSTAQAKALIQANHFDQAIPYLDKALRDNPSDIDALSERAKCFAKLSRFRPALADLTRALALNEDASLYAQRAAVLSELHLNDNAMRDLDKAVVLSPEKIEFLTQRADLLTRNGKLDAALADYDKALRLHPTGGMKEKLAASKALLVKMQAAKKANMQSRP